MATDTQIAANRINAQGSTGPRTEDGKARSAQNSTSHGLFARRDFVRPNETAEYEALTASMLDELRPEGILETTIAAEIISAAWRLRRCGDVEATLGEFGETAPDPMEDKSTLAIQNAVDRARGQAQRSMYRAMNEIRRLQTERRFREEFLPADKDPAELGLASCQEIVRSVAADNKRRLHYIRVAAEVNPADHLRIQSPHKPGPGPDAPTALSPAA
jgi:hypothetical protein